MFLCSGGMWRMTALCVPFLLLLGGGANGANMDDKGVVDVPGGILTGVGKDGEKFFFRVYVGVESGGRKYNALLDTGGSGYLDVDELPGDGECYVKIGTRVLDWICPRQVDGIRGVDGFGGNAILGLPALKSLGRVFVDAGKGKVQVGGAGGGGDIVLKLVDGDRRLGVRVGISGKESLVLLDTGWAGSIVVGEYGLCADEARPGLKRRRTLYGDGWVNYAECNFYWEGGRVTGGVVDAKEYMGVFPEVGDVVKSGFVGYEGIVGMGFFGGFSRFDIDLNAMELRLGR